MVDGGIIVQLAEPIVRVFQPGMVFNAELAAYRDEHSMVIALGTHLKFAFNKNNKPA